MTGTSGKRTSTPESLASRDGRQCIGSKSGISRPGRVFWLDRLRRSLSSGARAFAFRRFARRRFAANAYPGPQVLQRFRADAFHAGQIVDRSEGTVLLAVGHDPSRQPVADALDLSPFDPRRRVGVDAKLRLSGR